MGLSKMCTLLHMKQSGLKAALLVDPVDNLTVGGVAADSVAQQLADARVVVLIHRFA
ncbi:hypothetical protein D3C80_290840 [compost metagenome]